MTSASASGWLGHSFSQPLYLIRKLHLGRGRPHGNPSFDLGLTFFFWQPWCHSTVTNPRRDPQWEQQIWLKSFDAVFLWFFPHAGHTQSCPEATPSTESRLFHWRRRHRLSLKVKSSWRKDHAPIVHVTRCTLNPLDKVQTTHKMFHFPFGLLCLSCRFTATEPDGVKAARWKQNESTSEEKVLKPPEAASQGTPSVF